MKRNNVVLPQPLRPQHGEQFAALNGQRQIVEHRARTEAHRQMVDLHAARRS
ncbi:hypothetical protein GGD41_001271 [Paraburkholderia bryophila]|uniref:Uncharacterized protein n=1 Tax=Paraburkholderia bryophila TaxID=420952 RepID=A0A7Z0AYT1_9BURK|nr:hypothetical protein [Paraburkholderia bryophila]